MDTKSLNYYLANRGRYLCPLCGEHSFITRYGFLTHLKVKHELEGNSKKKIAK